MSNDESLFWEAAYSLRRWGLFALTAWLVLTLALAGLQQVQPSLYPNAGAGLLESLSHPEFHRCMRELTLMTISIWVWPTALLAVFFFIQLALGSLVQFSGWGRRFLKNAQSDRPLASDRGEALWRMDPWMWKVAAAITSAFKFGALFFAGFAVLWTGIAVSAYWDGRDQWEALPNVTPPYLNAFLARHPALRADRGTDTTGKVTLRDDLGHGVQLYGSELLNAEARLEKCPANLDVTQLGGITPIPGARCNTAVYLRNEQGEHTIYRFSISDGSDLDAIDAHVKRMSDANLFGTAGTSRSRGSYSFSASHYKNGWRIEINGRQGGATTIIIRHTTEPPKAAATDASQPQTAKP